MAAMCGSHYVLTVVVQSCYLDRVISSFEMVLHKLEWFIRVRYDVHMAVLEFMVSWASVSESCGRCWSHEEVG